MYVCRYLQEIGYTDAILDVRSSRVRSLLGLTDQNNKMAVGEVPRANHVNETEQLVSNKCAPTETATNAKDDNIVVKR